jgi:hypothetical protein
MDRITVAIYSRISHDPEGRQADVERRELDCRRMAEDRGWVVLEPVYRENDASASTRSKKRRPVFEQLMEDVAGGGGGRPPRPFDLPADPASHGVRAADRDALPHRAGDPHGRIGSGATGHCRWPSHRPSPRPPRPTPRSVSELCSDFKSRNRVGLDRSKNVSP